MWCPLTCTLVTMIDCPACTPVPYCLMSVATLWKSMGWAATGCTLTPVLEPGMSIFTTTVIPSKCCRSALSSTADAVPAMESATATKPRVRIFSPFLVRPLLDGHAQLEADGLGSRVQAEHAVLGARDLSAVDVGPRLPVRERPAVEGSVNGEPDCVAL